jgi:hypothetical protein
MRIVSSSSTGNWSDVRETARNFSTDSFPVNVIAFQREDDCIKNSRNWAVRRVATVSGKIFTDSDNGKAPDLFSQLFTATRTRRMSSMGISGEPRIGTDAAELDNPKGICSVDHNRGREWARALQERQIRQRRSGAWSRLSTA